MSLTRKNTTFGVAAVVAVALAAGGTAFAATGFHGKHMSRAQGAPGPPMGQGYGGPGGPGGPAGFHGARPFGDLSTAASYLGVSESSLLDSLRSGKTLAQVADATNGKSEAGLVDALVAAEQTRIDAAVKAGRLTPSDADRITSNLKQRITDLVEGTRPAPGRGGFGGPPPGGPCPDGPTPPTHV